MKVLPECWLWHHGLLFNIPLRFGRRKALACAVMHHKGVAPFTQPKELS